MSASHDRTDACLALGDGGERDARCHHAFFEKLAAEFHGQLAVTHNDGCDGCLARRRVHAADVESEIAQLFLEEVSVLPQVLDKLRLLLQHIECGDACRCHAWRMRGRKKKRSGALK